MNGKETAESRTGTTTRNIGETTKLASLLTLAAGAIALPQAAEGDIIVTDLGANPGHVGYLYSTSFLVNNLPGTAQLGFVFGRQGNTSYTSVRFLQAGQVGAQYLRMKTNAYLVVHVPAGLAWNQVGGTQFSYGTFGTAKYSQHIGNSYDHQYILFKFKDSTQGNALRYGWAEVSFANNNLNSSEGPEVTIWRYAYDNTGAQILTGDVGQVPEPTSLALLALGGLAVGANGVRAWRRNGTAASAGKP